MLHTLAPLEMPIQVEQRSHLLNECDCLALLNIACATDWTILPPFALPLDGAAAFAPPSSDRIEPRVPLRLLLIRPRVLQPRWLF